ncbi:MAG: winged helix-turn-helix domain-containing protein, partial [Verrucomicrobiota bacterium]
MSALSAAEQVLRETGSPLNYREISRIALKRGYWQSGGKTPWATVGAQLYEDIRKRGLASRFIQTGPETFALNPNPASATNAAPRRARNSSRKAAKKLSFTQAAEKILSDHGRKEPMHYREVTRKAMELGLLDTEGQTPEATMYA